MQIIEIPIPANITKYELGKMMGSPYVYDVSNYEFRMNPRKYGGCMIEIHPKTPEKTTFVLEAIETLQVEGVCGLGVKDNLMEFQKKAVKTRVYSNLLEEWIEGGSFGCKFQQQDTENTTYCDEYGESFSEIDLIKSIDDFKDEYNHIRLKRIGNIQMKLTKTIEKITKQ